MEVLSYADVFNAHSLLEPCCDLLRQNRDLIGADRFKNFQKAHIDMAFDVVRKSFIVNGVHTVYQFLVLIKLVCLHSFIPND